jgi:plasmid stabilization system protein ParE
LNLPVEVTRRAAFQIEAAAAWWAANRPYAPDAIRVDFQEAVTLLSLQPGAGAKSRSARYPDLRRLYLSRVRYHIYYQVLPERIVIVAFWHASRGSSPAL